MKTENILGIFSNMFQLKKILLLLAVFFSNYILLAQETSTEKGNVAGNITKESERSWYASPWIWVVLAALLILFLIAASRNNRKTG